MNKKNLYSSVSICSSFSDWFFQPKISLNPALEVNEELTQALESLDRLYLEGLLFQDLASHFNDKLFFVKLFKKDEIDYFCSQLTLIENEILTQKAIINTLSQIPVSVIENNALNKALYLICLCLLFNLVVLIMLRGTEFPISFAY